MTFLFRQGSARRKKKLIHRTNTTDDKRLQTSLKKLGLTNIPGIEEVISFHLTRCVTLKLLFGPVLKYRQLITCCLDQYLSTINSSRHHLWPHVPGWLLPRSGVWQEHKVFKGDLKAALFVNSFLEQWFTCYGWYCRIEIENFSCIFTCSCSVDHIDVHVPRSRTTLTQRQPFRVTEPSLWNGGLSPSAHASLFTPNAQLIAKTNVSSSCQATRDKSTSE